MKAMELGQAGQRTGASRWQGCGATIHHRPGKGCKHRSSEQPSQNLKLSENKLHILAFPLQCLSTCSFKGFFMSDKTDTNSKEKNVGTIWQEKQGFLYTLFKNTGSKLLLYPKSQFFNGLLHFKLAFLLGIWGKQVSTISLPSCSSDSVMVWQSWFSQPPSSEKYRLLSNTFCEQCTQFTRKRRVFSELFPKILRDMFEYLFPTIGSLGVDCSCPNSTFCKFSKWQITRVKEEDTSTGLFVWWGFRQSWAGSWGRWCFEVPLIFIVLWNYDLLNFSMPQVVCKIGQVSQRSGILVAKLQRTCRKWHKQLLCLAQGCWHWGAVEGQCCWAWPGGSCTARCHQIQCCHILVVKGFTSTRQWQYWEWEWLCLTL